MKIKSAPTISASLLLAAVSLSIGSPAEANGGTCVFATPEAEIVIDPALFDDPGAFDPSLFEPSTYEFGVTSTLNDPLTVELTMFFAGESYGPSTIGDSVTEIDPPQPVPSGSLWGGLNEYAVGLHADGGTQLDEDYSLQELESALLDPASYEASITVEIIVGGVVKCSYSIVFDVKRSNQRPCEGSYGYLCGYLDRFESESATLPNTL